MIMIGGEDALDQYFLRNPKELLDRDPESAVVNPFNPYIMEKHLICAAIESPLKNDEPFMQNAIVRHSVMKLENQGQLYRTADGKEFYPRRKYIHREVDLRGSGSRFSIVCSITGKSKGSIDGFRAFREAHPGAIYLHNSETYLVENLDADTCTIKIRPADVSYYTRVRASKDTEILEIYEQKTAFGTRVSLGKLKVTDQVTGYDVWQIHPSQKMGAPISLTLPPNIFETEGLWFDIPLEIQRDTEANLYHFMGGIHAVEHAGIGIFPLLVMADRNDVGGISTPYHPQVGCAAVFIYDGIPGGSGLSREAFHKAEKLLTYTLNVIATCSCENGCPSCVYSPKCGAGNRPIDKRAAEFILSRIINSSAPSFFKKISEQPVITPITRKETKESGHYGVLDVETRRSAQDVGGWNRADLMGISCAILYDSQEDQFLEFLQEDIPELAEHLRRLDMIIGFNIKRFDYTVLRGCYNFDFQSLPTLDLLEHVHKHLGYRLSLDSLAKSTLGTEKNGDGLLALKWWKEGRIREIIEYCKSDVRITRDLFLYGKENGYLLFTNKSGKSVRVPVDWG
jgi:DEAD/DEAH box helicase domain-containing protein